MPQLPVAGFDLRALGVKGAQNTTFFALLRDIHKAAGATVIRQFGDVDIARRVKLAKAEKPDVESATTVKVKLRRPINHRARLRTKPSGHGEHGAAVGAVLDVG